MSMYCKQNVYEMASSFNYLRLKLEQLGRLRSEDTPRRLIRTHTIESYWIPSQNKLNMRHTL